MKSTMKSDKSTWNRCQKCNELLSPGKEVWLELNKLENLYKDGFVDPEFSQGGFPFGAACANRVIENGGKI